MEQRKGSHPAAGRLAPFIDRRPVVSALFVLIAFLIVSFLFGIGAEALLPQYQPEFVAVIGLTVVVLGALAALRWWRETGFNAPARWRDAHLLLVPAIIVAVLPFLRGFKGQNTGMFVYLLAAYALTGIMEEGLFRGIVMRILRPTGVARSVWISALLFSFAHVGNMLYRNPVIVLSQMVGAFVFGIGAAAIRLRTNTIWFMVVLHAVHDLALQYSNFPLIPLDVAQVTLLMLYGLYLLRAKERLTTD
ncbi:MAG: Abortive infection protein [Symbiobacteriaceae bacterium]|nr:Abortive infection protein [Symbiobacteriaceae bacterium]